MNDADIEPGIFRFDDQLYRVQYSLHGNSYYAKTCVELKDKICRRCEGTGKFTLMSFKNPEEVYFQGDCKFCRGYGHPNNLGVFVYEGVRLAPCVYLLPHEFADFLLRSPAAERLSLEEARALGIAFRQCQMCNRILTSDDSMAKFVGMYCELHALRAKVNA